MGNPLVNLVEVVRQERRDQLERERAEKAAFEILSSATLDKAWQELRPVQKAFRFGGVGEVPARIVRTSYGILGPRVKMTASGTDIRVFEWTREWAQLAVSNYTLGACEEFVKRLSERNIVIIEDSTPTCDFCGKDTDESHTEFC